MNLAFQALLLLLLYLPGAIAVYVYFRGQYGFAELPVISPSVTARTTLALVVAGALHAIWVPMSNLLASFFWDLRVDLATVTFLIIGKYDDQAQFRHAIQSITIAPYLVFFYFVTIYAVAIALGDGFRRWVIAKSWDARHPILRFTDLWFYLFSGKVLDFARAEEVSVANGQDNESSPDEPGFATEALSGTWISGVMEIAGKAYLYTGILEGYWYDRNGALDAIWLSNVYRRDLSDDRDEPDTAMTVDDRYYPVDGDYFVMKFSDLKNVNIKYISVE